VRVHLGAIQIVLQVIKDALDRYRLWREAKTIKGVENEQSKANSLAQPGQGLKDPDKTSS
jgi:hypothetical protein